MPLECSGVPAEILNPKNTWQDKDLYDKKSAELAGAFIRNFVQYKAYASSEMLEAFPKVLRKQGSTYAHS
ncbi:hypothetical protein ACXZ1K_03350 [Pedobacter sp. PWIIR3]